MHKFETVYARISSGFCVPRTIEMCSFLWSDGVNQNMARWLRVARWLSGRASDDALYKWPPLLYFTVNSVEWLIQDLVVAGSRPGRDTAA